ncbi:hypothetical protein PAMP_018577 [Pampus punctatissimus]
MNKRCKEGEKKVSEVYKWVEMTLGIPEWWLGLREGGGQEQDGCRDAERRKAEGQTEGETWIPSSPHLALSLFSAQGNAVLQALIRGPGRREEVGQKVVLETAGEQGWNIE